MLFLQRFLKCKTWTALLEVQTIDILVFYFSATVKKQQRNHKLTWSVCCHEFAVIACLRLFWWWTCRATGLNWAGPVVPTAFAEAASATLSASVSGPPWRQPWPDNGGPPQAVEGWLDGGEGGTWRWRDEVEGERPCWKGGRGVTLTEPAVDKTLRQIRQRRVWSLFCFPLLLLSGGILLLSVALFLDSPSTSFFFFLLNLLNSSHTSSLLSLSKQKDSCCYQTWCSWVQLRHLFSSCFLKVFLFFPAFWLTERDRFLAISTFQSISLKSPRSFFDHLCMNSAWTPHHLQNPLFWWHHFTFT